MTVTEPELKSGRVVGIAGPVVDVEFPPGSLPEINRQLRVELTLDGNQVIVPLEVAQQIGDNRVRAISMKPTDGLTRGAEVVNTGHGMQMPVGDATLGHVWNVMGEPLDVPEVDIETYWDIHRPCLLYTSPSPRDGLLSRMPSSA